MKGLREEEGGHESASQREANSSAFLAKRRSATHGQSVSVHVHTKEMNFVAHHEPSSADHQPQLQSPTTPGRSVYAANGAPQRQSGSAHPVQVQNQTANTSPDQELPLDPAQRRRVAGLAIAAVASQQNGALNNQLNMLTNLA